eukprot:993803_1
MAHRVFEVEAILNHELRQYMNKEETYYFVKWKGYDNPADNTWEPRAGLHHLEMFKEYERLHRIIGGIRPMIEQHNNKSTIKTTHTPYKKIKIK